MAADPEENIPFTEAQAKETLFPGSIWWNITSYSFLSKQTDEYVESPQFYTGPNKEATWCIKFFPGGTTANPGCYASLKLVCCSYPEHSVIAKFRLRCCDAAEFDLVFPVESEYRIFSTRHEQLMLLETKGATFDEGLQRRSVPLPHDQIDIICDIVVLKPGIIGHLTKLLSPREDLSEDLEMLLLSGKHADTMITTPDSSLMAHRAILAARSTKFSHFFDEVEDKFHLPLEKDVKYSVTSELVHFLYAGTVPGLQDMPIDLFIAANKYRVKDLKNVCEEYLINNSHILTVDRATELLAITFEFEVEQKLKDRILRFVREHKREILGTSQWEQMLKRFPKQASDLIMYSLNM